MKYPLMSCCLIASCLIALPAIAHGLGAHVHGAATLQIVVDGDTLTLDLESPLDSVLGFEHLPRTEPQKAAVRAMSERLHDAATLFRPSVAAQCTVASVKLESPVLAPAKEGADAGHEEGHADLDAEFVFRCAHPAALNGVDVNLFDAFLRLQRLDVQSVGKRGQKAATLTAAQRHVDL